MDENYMENLARAYNEKLAGTARPEYSDALHIAEEQSGILERMSQAPGPLLRYLKSLKNAVANDLKNLEGKRSVPTNKSPGGRGGVERLTNLEIDLFIALDTLRADGKDVDSLINTETRFAAFLGLLGSGR